MSLDSWGLEVVRGRSLGKLYPVSAGPLILGNAPGSGGGPSLDLKDEEGDAPRKMAPRQASLERSGTGWTVRDLDTPGGTFVNRKRVLPGQSLDLKHGDVLQLGGVQLKLVARSSRQAGSPAIPAPTPSTSIPTPLVVPGGSPCRTWDDVLTASAQRWGALREELTSGRIETALRSLGRLDLLPAASGTPDERLDAWLAGLPTTKANGPSLDVHPATLSVKVAAGGGSTRRSIALANVGYRLLKVRARVELGADWLKPAGEFAHGSVSVVESAELPLDITIPEALPVALVATLVIESNGGDRRVTVRLEPSNRVEAFPEAPTAPAAICPSFLEEVSTPKRIVVGAFVLALARVLVGVCDVWIRGEGIVPLSAESPGLFGPVVVFSVVGGLAGAALAARKKPLSVGNVATAAVASAVASAFSATILVAACRSVDPAFGAFGRSPWLVPVLWAAIGAGLAAVSAWLVPKREGGTA